MSEHRGSHVSCLVCSQSVITLRFDTVSVFLVTADCKYTWASSLLGNKSWSIIMILHHRQALSSVRTWFCFTRKYKTDQEGFGKLAEDLGLLSLLRSCFLICAQSLPSFSFLVPYFLSVLSLLVLECLLPSRGLVWREWQGKAFPTLILISRKLMSAGFLWEILFISGGNMKPHSFANYGVSFCNFMELLFYEVICRKASCREMLWLEIDYRYVDILFLLHVQKA